MTAEILAVGTELLLGDIANTNAQFLSRELAALGIGVYRHTTVGDNPGRITDAYREAFERADLVIATGGLGPTSDDITKDVAAEFLGVPLVLNEESWAAIRERFARMNMPLTDNNKRQAYLPEGCVPLRNDNGSAPGVYYERDGKVLILLPGPPNEMEPMFTTQAVPFLRLMTGGVFVSRTLKLAGIGESRAAEIIQDIIDKQTNPTVAPYAKTAEVWLRITASAADEAQARALIAPTADAIYERLGEFIFGEDDDSLTSVVAKRLEERGLTIALAESCTGGMVTESLIAVPGISRVLLEGLVTYGNEAKINRLNVPAQLIAAHGAVSREAAAAMAEGAARTSGANVGLSTTGIAGPDGGTDEKPVGLVYLGLHIDGRGTVTEKLTLTGNREAIRRRATKAALNLLRKSLT
jgi:nicotinamide-nucleotide amidase